MHTCFTTARVGGSTLMGKQLKHFQIKPGRSYLQYLLCCNISSLNAVKTISKTKAYFGPTWNRSRIIYPLTRFSGFLGLTQAEARSCLGVSPTGTGTLLRIKASPMFENKLWVCLIIEQQQYVSILAWPMSRAPCWYILHPGTRCLHATLPSILASASSNYHDWDEIRAVPCFFAFAGKSFPPPGQRAFPKPQGGKVGKVGVWVDYVCYVFHPIPCHPPTSAHPIHATFEATNTWAVAVWVICIIVAWDSPLIGPWPSHMRHPPNVEVIQDARTKPPFSRQSFVPNQTSLVNGRKPIIMTNLKQF